MKFGIAKDIRSEVRECTPDLLNQALDSPHVAKVCAEIEDTLEKLRQGAITKDEYETLKGQLKKRLPIFTFHATFKNGRRKNDDAFPSGLSIYDLDHIPNPREKWAEIEARKEELGILLSHISPSLEGLRLVFVMPQGMDLAQAQAWMANQLGDTKYDSCVKDCARCSFVVPREYVLYMDVDGLFSPQISQINTDKTLIPADGISPQSTLSSTESLKFPSDGISPQMTQIGTDEKLIPADGLHEENNIKNNPCKSVESVVQTYPPTYEDIPYESIVETLEEQMGGRPEHGSRNTFIFSMACHVWYVCNDDPDWIAQIMPNYGEAKAKWMASIRSACARNQTKAMPRIMKRTLNICKQREAEESEIRNQKSIVRLPCRNAFRHSSNCW